MQVSNQYSVGLRATGVKGFFGFSIAGKNMDTSKLCEDKLLLRQTLQEFFGKKSDLKFGNILRSSIYSYVFWMQMIKFSNVLLDHISRR